MIEKIINKTQKGMQSLIESVTGNNVNKQTFTDIYANLHTLTSKDVSAVTQITNNIPTISYNDANIKKTVYREYPSNFRTLLSLVEIVHGGRWSPSNTEITDEEKQIAGYVIYRLSSNYVDVNKDMVNKIKTYINSNSSATITVKSIVSHLYSGSKKDKQDDNRVNIVVSLLIAYIFCHA